MSKAKKTWNQKWTEAKAKEELPKVFDCDKSGMKILVPGPADIERIVRSIPVGQVRTVKEIADELNLSVKADLCCPLTTGIFTWLLAHYAHEVKDDSIPWWRVVKAKGELNPKFPEGPELQTRLLESEGHQVEQKGKKVVVVGVKS